MRKTFLPIFVLLYHAAVAQSVFVPQDHQVYPLLVKGETLGLFESYQMRVLPLTRTVVLDLLHQINKKRAELSGADAALLDQMMGEFTDPKIGEEAPAESEIHLYRYEEGNAQFFIDVRGQGGLRLHRGRLDIPDETIGEVTGWGSIRGRIGEHVVFALSAHNSGSFGKSDREERFDPGRGQTQVVVGKGVFTDQSTGYVGVTYGVFHLTAGRTDLSWGSGLNDRLGLSALNEPMDQFRFTLDYERFRFTYFHANLQGFGDSRYLAGHRLDLLLGSVQLGLYETVVYARRGAQLGYLNPLVPYHVIEHQLGDKDNNMLGIDATVKVAPGVRGFAEIFVDDYSLDFPLGTYWGNKLAYLAGVHWAAPFGWTSAEILASYTRVDPYVYTHSDSLNTYAHYGVSVGSRLGPNAERFQLGLLVRPIRDLLLQADYLFVRKGKGDVFTPHRPADGDAKGFLSGILERQHFLTIAARYQFLRDMFAGFDASLLDRADAFNTSGLRAKEKSVRLYIDINY